jgi:hypothetical protein
MPDLQNSLRQVPKWFLGKWSWNVHGTAVSMHQASTMVGCMPSSSRMSQHQAQRSQHYFAADSLSNLTRLTMLGLASNKLKTPLLDASRLACLRVLFLGGNPLNYVPELSPAKLLHTLSLAALLITAANPDDGFSQVNVAYPKPSTRMGLRGARSPLPDDLIALLFGRSFCQHPLLTGALAELAKDPDIRAALLRVDRVVPQIVHLMHSERSGVAAHACQAMCLLAEEAGGAATLEKAAIADALYRALTNAEDSVRLTSLQVCYLFWPWLFALHIK